jgi:hypothetical protein
MAFSVVLFRAKIFQSRIHEKDFGPPRQWGTGTKAPVLWRVSIGCCLRL